MGKTSFYLSSELEKKLRLTKERGLSKTVSRIIDRYFYIIEIEKKKISKMFIEEEWNTIYAICNGVIWEPSVTIRNGVLNKLQDSLDSDIERFGADKNMLEVKIKALTPFQNFALVEMIEEWLDCN